MSASEEVPTSTGDPQVDRILEALDELDTLPVTEHAGLLLDVHDRLGSSLTPEQKIRTAGVHGAP